MGRDEVQKTNECEIDYDDELIKKHACKELNRLTVILCLIIVFSYFLGYMQFTFLVPVIMCGYAFWIWKVKIDRIHDWFYSEHEMREHRKRAFQNAETVEWFNFLLNRWWFFSDRTIYDILKRGLDPILEQNKPKMIENIGLHDFTLGNRTPYLKYMRVYDTSADLRKQMASEVTYRNPPSDLPIRPKYQVVIDADMGLDAPDSKLIIRTKIGQKLGDTDIVVEHFQIRGRIQLTLHFNQSIPFPHLAAFTISFLHEPKVGFSIRLLKKIQLMEFPVIRNWISEIVNDSLKITLVDPGHVTIPLCNDPELLGRQSGYASGVLTLTIKGGVNGKAVSDEQWCTITLDKQKLKTKEITCDVLWQEQVSLLVHSLQYDKLRLKIKGKRRFGPNYTVVEYILPLIRLNLEQDPEQDTELLNENIEGSCLQVHLDYSSLPVLDVSNTIDEETFQKNYIEINGQEEPEEVSGVLFVRVHKGSDLIPMDSNGTSDPYVMIFSNSELVQMGHVVEESLNPEWDTMVEFFTLDYTQTSLSFVLHDRNPMVLPTVLLADDNDDFMGSCNMVLTKSDWCVFKRELDVLFKFHGNHKKGQQETVKKVGKITVSVIFRPISSIKTTVRAIKNVGLPEGEPLYQKRTKIDAVTMEAILCSERGSLTICILRARNLVALDLNGRSDPFVILRIGNLKQEKFKTKVVYRTLNPVWNEQVTLALPQKHQRISIEVFDKDPFTQEKMGVVRFGYEDLIHLGEGGLTDKHWFDLEQAKSGEIQLAFSVKMPESQSDETDALVAAKPVNEKTKIYDSYSYASDGSEEYLILDPANETNIPTPIKHNDNMKEEKEITVSTASIDEENGIVDFSGEPFKYFGIYGKLIEIIGLNTHGHIDEIYAKVKLDRHAKFQQPARRSLLNRSDRILCRTSNLGVESRITINDTFQMKAGIGVSPCIYLVLEVKSDKKGKDIIDSHSMLLRNFFKGQNPAIRLIELDNGGQMRLQLGHTMLENDNHSSFSRKKFRSYRR